MYPRLEMRSVRYVNDIRVIAAQDNLVSILNALTIDLTGQVASEHVGPRPQAGPGGQPEIAIGSVLAKGGRSIMVMPATARGGKVSRIVPHLERGSVVTVTRAFVDYVVTEYGVACLMGKSARQRVEELIAIAHPDFRGELRVAARKLFWP
jgi:4-hydroxybutyrate CoA-transferase